MSFDEIVGEEPTDDDLDRLEALGAAEDAGLILGQIRCLRQRLIGGSGASSGGASR